MTPKFKVGDLVTNPRHLKSSIQHGYDLDWVVLAVSKVFSFQEYTVKCLKTNVQQIADESELVFTNPPVPLTSIEQQTVCDTLNRILEL